MRRLLAPALFLLFGSIACTDSPLLEPELEVSADMGRVPGDPAEVMVAVPWKTDFSVWNHTDYTDERCGGFPNFYLTMKGHGNISHFGKITAEFTFCWDASTGRYWDTHAVFVAANGDELYAEVLEGQIYDNLGDNSDYYQSWFDDPGIFTGGTGRFAGASGTWTTDAWVHNDSDGPGPDEWRTDFFGKGTLILEKGKNKGQK